MKDLFMVLFFIALIFSGVMLQWWSCSERFPNATLACFVTNK